MNLFAIIILCIVLTIVVGIIFKKTKTAMQQRSEEQRKFRQRSIEPSITFYLEKSDPKRPENGSLHIENTGAGTATGLTIQDFHNPEENQWHFRFKTIGQLEPGEKKTIEFDFYVGEYKAANKTEQLWMFDPDHDHDFAAQIVIDFFDIDGNAYSNTIVIGENDKSQSTRKRRQKQIQAAMSRGR